jgi:hypothetical protein
VRFVTNGNDISSVESLGFVTVMSVVFREKVNHI